MFKDYEYNTQKGKIIRIFLLKNNEWLRFEDCINYANIFVGGKSGSRLSEMLSDGICEVERYENPNKYKGYLGYPRAKYRLTQEALSYYKDLYLQERINEVSEFMELDKKNWFEKIFNF